MLNSNLAFPDAIVTSAAPHFCEKPPFFDQHGTIDVNSETAALGASEVFDYGVPSMW